MKDLKIFVRENTWLRRGLLDFGWGNGYVCIPEGHPCFGMDHNEIYQKYEDLSVHGGLTFSESSDDLDWPEIPEGKWWIVGFDTSHYNDNLLRWPDRESVLFETDCLKAQLEKISSYSVGE